MTKRTRKAVFSLFVFGFVLAAPLVVLYTAGYRYSFNTGIVQTGMFSVSSLPKGAALSLDGELLRSVTPSLIKNVLPGDHRIRVEMSGYSVWEKTLTVHSRSTTFADDVVLFLETAPSLIRETSLAALRFNQKTGRAAYAQTEGQWTEIWTHDFATGNETLVSRLPVGSEAHVELDWPREDATLSIRTVVRGVTDVTYVDSDTAKTIDALPDTGIDLSVLADRVAVSRRVPVGRQGDETSNVILAYVPLGTYELRHAPDGIVLLEDVERRRVLLVRADGGDQPILLNASATVWAWEPDGKRLLYSDGFDLHVYDAGLHTDTTMTRLSAMVTGVAWYPGHAAVLYAQDDAIYATELDHRDGRNTVQLVSGSNLGAMHVRRNTLSFFGTSNETTGLFARPLD